MPGSLKTFKGVENENSLQESSLLSECLAEGGGSDSDVSCLWYLTTNGWTGRRGDCSSGSPLGLSETFTGVGVFGRALLFGSGEWLFLRSVLNWAGDQAGERN